MTPAAGSEATGGLSSMPNQLRTVAAWPASTYVIQLACTTLAASSVSPDAIRCVSVSSMWP